MPYELLMERIPLGAFDMGGVLYHANYFSLYEQTREGFLAERGYPYASLVAEEGLHLAVVESQQQFRNPIYYGDSVTISLCAREVKSSTVTFEYGIRKDDDVVHTASTKHILVKNTPEKGFQRARFAKGLREILEQIKA